MKIVISPKMLEAGRRALGRPLKKGAISDKELGDVWRAMAKQCPPIRVTLPASEKPTALNIQLS